MTWSDFRSDTVTQPTPAMRRAMAEAPVGDDVLEEDPTVRALEEEVAALLGHEAALFCPSGSMGNQICLRVHARSGSELLAEARSHVLAFEMGAPASLSGLMPRPVDAPRGVLTPDLLAPHVAPAVSYRAPTGVVVVENTHNAAGGTVATRAELEPVLAFAAARDLPVHLDGARLWNAAAALDVPERALAAGFSSVMVCFSKGLRAPVGSAVAGARAFVAAARRVRKLFGGGMRQVGVLAAAARVAVRDERGRLAEDHARARRLAEGLGLDPATVDTNIVLVPVADASRAAASLRASGVLAMPAGPAALRFVTHADTGDADVARAVAAFRQEIDR
jgi:threonine aldolase